LINIIKRYLKDRHFKNSNPVLNDECTEFEINKWALSRFVISKLVPIVGVHPFPLDELLLLAAAVTKIRPTHIFEWGTNIGKSARVFYETGKFFNITIEIHSIDLPDEAKHLEHPGAKRGLLVKGLKEVKLHTGDGLETAMRICRTIGLNNIVPLFFIDGDHGYHSVKRELSGIINALPEAGILLHDTFYQSSESGYNVGPYQAIKDVVTDAHNYKFIRQDLGLPGMTLIYKKQK